MSNDAKQLEKVRSLLRQFDSGMFVTHSAPETAAPGEVGDTEPVDRIHARPMVIADVEDDATLVFVTSLSSTKVTEVSRRPDVGVTLQKSGAYVALVGRAQVVVDVNQKRQVWSKMDSAWFDDPADPEAALLRVRPSLVEYWDNRGINAVRYALEALRGITTGEAPKTDERQHGAVDL